MSEPAPAATTAPDCLFCRIVAGELPSRQVYADDTAIAFLDIAPFHRGHTLVVPRRHVADVLAEPDAVTELAPAIAATTAILRDRLTPDGLNLFTSAGTVAGQEVDHLHVHLVPRYATRAGLRSLFERSTSDDGADLDAVHAELTR